MLAELKQIPDAWRKAWASPHFRNHLVLTLLAFAASALYQFHYLRLSQARSGTPFNDFIHNLLPPIDFSLPIFFLEYSTLLLVLVFVLPYPDRLVKGLQMFALVLLARVASVYLVPLEPPRDMINLYDPVANFFLHTPDVFVTKDLFFSGHVSAIMLFFLIASQRWVKYYALFALVTVSVMIVWQHVHYSIDVAFAPVASYTIYRFVWWAHPQTKYGLELKDA